MKRFLTLLVLSSIVRLSFGQIIQIGDTTSKSIDRFTEPGAEYVSESKKIGSITYNNWFGNGVDLNILIRKFIDRATGHYSKDVVFSGKIGDSYYSGYIDQSEIDDAISGLKFINDSLLPFVPTDEIRYSKHFKHSNFGIFAEFDPYPTSIFDSNGYHVYIDLNRYGWRNFVQLKTQDVLNLIRALQAAKVKLKDF